ncbi:MAG: sulfatase [Vicinamibacterales bacterium]
MPLSSVVLLAIAVWLGVVAGFCELLAIAVEVLKPQDPWPGFLYTNPHELWLTPLASGLLVLAVGAAVVLAGRLLPWVILPQRALMLIAIPACLAAVFHFRSSVDERALLILSCGLGFQLALFTAKRVDGFVRVVRRTMPVAFFLIGLLALTVVGRPRLSEYLSLARLPAPDPAAPNLVLIIMDTVRASEVELDAASTLTPSLKVFSRTGTRFDRAMATAPWTLPSIGTMFTGRLPREIFSRGETPLNARTPLPGDYATIAEVLRDRGYFTAGFVANTVYGSVKHGLNRGFIHYEDYSLTWESFWGSSALFHRTYDKLRRLSGNRQAIDRKTATDVSASFLRWLDRRGSRPFFAFLNYFDAHDPYAPPARFEIPGAVRPQFPAIDPFYRYPSNEIMALRQAYQASVSYVDDEIGVLLRGLRDRGLVENTLVVITSDHGEHFGEHELMTHGNSVYRALLAVPLIMSFPKRIPEGMIVRRPISLRDLAATMLGVLEVRDQRFGGASLARYWSDPGQASTEISDEPLFSDIMVGNEPHGWAPKHWPVSRGRMRSIVADGYHYIRDGAGREELYDFRADTDEREPLGPTPELEAIVTGFRRLLESAEGDGRVAEARLSRPISRRH